MSDIIEYIPAILTALFGGAVLAGLALPANKGDSPDKKSVLAEDKPTAINMLIGDGMFRTSVVGESYYHANLQDICIAKEEHGVLYCLCRLEMEDSNPYDKNAVGVYIEKNKVGHLSKSDAVVFRELTMTEDMRQQSFHCKAAISGGAIIDDQCNNFGIEIDIDLQKPLRAIKAFEEDYPKFYETPTETKDGNDIILTLTFPPLEWIERCKPYMYVTPWTKPGHESIHFYLDFPGAIYGQGRLAVIKRNLIPVISSHNIDDLQGHVETITGRKITIRLS